MEREIQLFLFKTNFRLTKSYKRSHKLQSCMAHSATHGYVLLQSWFHSIPDLPGPYSNYMIPRKRILLLTYQNISKTEEKKENIKTVTN